MFCWHYVIMMSFVLLKLTSFATNWIVGHHIQVQKYVLFKKEIVEKQFDEH